MITTPRSAVGDGDVPFPEAGEMSRLTRELDWSRTPIGALDQWPASLRTAAGICLSSRHPMVIWWGPELVLLYNDAWIPILGPSKHPALGKPGAEVWPEMWHIIGAQMSQVLATGQATWSDDQLLPADRYGYLEEAYFTYSYSPIREDGRVGGVFTAVTETTARVLGDRRLRTLRTLGDISARSSPTVVEACRAAVGALQANTADVPFSALYLVDGDGLGASLAAHHGVDPSILAGRLPGPGFGEEVWRVAQSGQATVCRQVSRKYPGVFARPASPVGDADADQAVILPLTAAGKARVAGVLVAGVSPYRALDGEYRAFFDLVAAQVAMAVSDAEAYAAERRRTQALADLDRAKSEFFSNVSHEFRTPLTLILGPVEDALAARAPGSDATMAPEVLAMVHRNALRLRKLVDSLLDFSRLEAGRMQAERRPVDLGAFTAELAGQFRSAVQEGAVRLEVHCPAGLAPVPVDPDMWEKIVLNLVSNACKFTFAGTVSVALAREGDQVVLTVSDTGIGIPASESPRLFERFHRVPGARSRTHEGTGIGLALVRELVGLHDGQISVESSPGVGTTFRVSIPAGEATAGSGTGDIPDVAPRLARAFVDEASGWLLEPPDGRTPDPANSAAERAPAAPSPGPGLRVVVVDDNADLRAYLSRILGAHWGVEAYADGERAARAIAERPPDLVVSDVMMPGLDGFGLLRSIRANPATERLPVILLSARAGEGAAVEGLGIGADDYLVKPFSARELVARVQAHLELAQLREAAARAAQRRAAQLSRLAGAAIQLGSCPKLDECLTLIRDTALQLLEAGRAAVRVGRAGPLDRDRPGEEDGELSVPMLGSDGQVLGTIEVSAAEGSRFDTGDQAVLVQLAQLAAGRMETLRILDRERRVAATLQASLLPDRLPELAGVPLAARYRPGSDEAAVGGDWYDACVLPDGSLAIVVGDVVGQGVTAAATMGQLRYALRALYFQGYGPGQGLELLNRLVDSLGNQYFSTVVSAVLDPASKTLRYVCAGHPPPLVVSPSGRTTWLDQGHSVPLGAMADASYPEATVELEPGASLLFYTDGLIERRGQDIDRGLERLAAHASAYRGDPDILVEAILEVLDDDARHDDIAALAVTMEPAVGDGLTLGFPGVATFARLVRGRLRRWLDEAGMGEDDLYDLVLAAGELTANAIEHPHARPGSAIRVTAGLDGEDVVIAVADPGPWRAGPPGADRGRGLGIVDAFVDQRHTRVDGEGTTVTIRKRLRGGGH